MQQIKLSLIGRTLFEAIPASVRACAARLYVLTNGRVGSKKHRPDVMKFYETGIVFSLYEHLLMTPPLAHLDIRWEMAFPAKRRPKQVDLWLRPWNGGNPHLLEAGDFQVGKVHSDCRKMRKLNPKGTNWFLAFFRDGAKVDVKDPWATIIASIGRKNGLDNTVVKVDDRLAASFEVFRPEGGHDWFGYALFQTA